MFTELCENGFIFVVFWSKMSYLLITVWYAPKSMVVLKKKKETNEVQAQDCTCLL